MKTIPTQEAISIAYRNAQRDGGSYNLNDLLADEGLWMVSHKSGDRTRCYTVDTLNGTCECEAFNRSGVCKHQVIVDDEIQIRHREDEFEAAEDARFFTLDLKEGFKTMTTSWVAEVAPASIKFDPHMDRVRVQETLVAGRLPNEQKRVAELQAAAKSYTRAARRAIYSCIDCQHTPQERQELAALKAALLETIQRIEALSGQGRG